jgi:hypothetical protein
VKIGAKMNCTTDSQETRKDGEFAKSKTQKCFGFLT